MGFQNLLVTKLPRNLSDSDLLAVFLPHGAVSASMMVDATTGEGKGFGFVLFASEALGMAAHAKLNGRRARVGTLQLRIEAHPSRHDGQAAAQPSRVLYVRNLPSWMCEYELRQVLSAHGALASLVLRIDLNDYSKVLATAEYDCLDCSGATLRALHRTYLPGLRHPILVKYSDSVEKKRPPPPAVAKVAAPDEAPGRRARAPSGGEPQQSGDLSSCRGTGGGDGGGKPSSISAAVPRNPSSGGDTTKSGDNPATGKPTAAPRAPPRCYRHDPYSFRVVESDVEH